MNCSGINKLFFTNKSVEQLKKLEKVENVSVVLRIRVSSGGCAGLKYVFSLERFYSKASPEDIQITQDGVSVVTDALSMKYIQGSTIDYQETLMMSQFVVLNPNSDEQCSCGSSFQIKN
ncbi:MULTISPECIES: HesB/IscA family protein [Holospora]|uniref:Iron-sulfur cluster insertion protein ErpA n=2 Tax=Holospora TaxID=44747 RepID=A0A061JI39_9PROT|nr:MULTISPECIES: iron-sulfur cluster assembly accessory protein [Holospora]ETZ05148.1 iron-sulfur cluster insertion protein ErpA [Holospora undulata HU1]GAJ46799.1 iron-sulfur cluster insertion protein ErpA [Holospora elegans E1]